MPPALLGGRAGTRTIGPIVTTAVPAAGIFWLAYDGGGYTLSSYTSAAIAVPLALLVGAATGLLPVGRMTRPALAVSLLLAAFAGLAAASAFWGANAEATYAEFARAVLYLAVFALVAVGITGATSARLADGLAIGISAVSVLS